LQELSRQTLQLERFNTDFAVELAGVLDDRLNRTLAASLTQAVAPVVSAVNNLSGNMGSMSQGAIETMIKDFQTGLKQSTGDELASVVGALGQVRETLEHAAAGLQANGANFGSRLDQVAAQIEQRLDNATRTMSDGLAGTMTEIMSSVAATLGQARETLERTSSGLQANGADFGSRLDKVAEQIEQRLDSATRGMSDGLAGTMAEIGDLLRGLSKGMHDDAKRVSGSMSEANQRTLSALNEAGAAFSAEIRQTGADFAQTLAGSLTGPLAVLPQFERTLTALDGRFAQQVDAFDRSTERLHDLAAQLEQSNRSLKDAAAPIASTANTFLAAAQRIEAAGSALHASSGRIAELNSQLKDTFEANRRIWDEYRTRFEQVDGHLEGVVRQLTDGTRAYHQEIAAFVTNLDAQLAKAVSSFSGAVSELGEVTEGLEEQMRGANGGSRHDHGSRLGRPS
jgi:exonuclease VII small subunit/chaperonin cofactor prefoldin